MIAVAAVDAAEAGGAAGLVERAGLSLVAMGEQVARARGRDGPAPEGDGAVEAEDVQFGVDVDELDEGEEGEVAGELAEPVGEGDGGEEHAVLGWVELSGRSV